VFSKVVTFFNTKGQHAKAVELGNMLLESSAVELVQADESLLLSAWDWFQQYADKSFSLADCVSFALMRQRGLERALAFDRHFIQAGFQKLP
jgi:predicted nucleic acid-binding protein